MKKTLSLKDVKYVKIKYVDRWDAENETKAAITRTSASSISVSAKTEERIFVKTPQEIELNFICDDGIYKTKTNMKSAEYEEPYMTFSLDIPKNIKYRQDREFFRVKLTEGAILSFTTDEETKKITCKTYDISANGVCLELPERIDIPEDVSLTILFDRHDIKADAKFIRITGDENSIRASFSFVKLKKQDTDYISKICITKQLEDKREKYDN